MCANLLDQPSNGCPGNGMTPPHEGPSTSEGVVTGAATIGPRGSHGEPTKFFERTDSILFRGSEPGEDDTERSNVHFFTTDGTSLDSADIFTPVGPWGASTMGFTNPLSEPCPLAQQPYLLRSSAKKEDLFKSPLNSRKKLSRDGSKVSRRLPPSIAQGDVG